MVGRLLFSHSIFTYLGIAMAVAMGLYLHRSRSGLYLRAVGESPATADAAGISVTRCKYLATVIGGGISAIGGMVYIMTVVGGVWNHEGLSGVGWLAVALVIFCLWSPYRAIWGSILFGGLLILYLRMPIDLIPDQIYKILPYVVTVIVLVFTSMRNNRDKLWAWHISGRSGKPRMFTRFPGCLARRDPPHAPEARRPGNSVPPARRRPVWAWHISGRSGGALFYWIRGTKAAPPAFAGALLYAKKKNDKGRTSAPDVRPYRRKEDTMK